MARDGSGTFTRVVTPPVNGDVANATDFNSEMNDIADALTDSINTAGTKAFADDQSMGGNKLTDLAAPTSSNDAARKLYVDDAITAAAQPLDATLTAIAALSWSSGNALVQFTAADTVSLTLTPSVSSVTASQGAAATTPSGTFVNTTDSASVRALRIEGDRATPANNDLVYTSFYLSSGAGTQRESGRIASQLWDVTNGAEYGAMTLGVIANGTLTNLAYLNPFEFSPNTNDGLPLGSTSRAWSDADFANGAVLRWNNAFTLTHVTGGLEANGFIEARVPLSSETSGTLTAASANRKVACSGGVTLDDGVFTADDFILFDPGTSARTFTRASGLTMYVNGTDSASATLAANQMGTAHWRSSTVVVLAGSFS